jgi:hypothetical protein
VNSGANGSAVRVVMPLSTAPAPIGSVGLHLESAIKADRPPCDFRYATTTDAKLALQLLVTLGLGIHERLVNQQHRLGLEPIQRARLRSHRDLDGSHTNLSLLGSRRRTIQGVTCGEVQPRSRWGVTMASTYRAAAYPYRRSRMLNRRAACVRSPNGGSALSLGS